ncbi:hypothetical protein ACFFJB_06960 [Camelimonas abortus]|uniref:Cysteine rich repeat protein n=1 Tax=Camelimonas abortus TaxID=1017184 RepID=A0ABV7LD42_9HYPH
MRRHLTPRAGAIAAGVLTLLSCLAGAGAARADGDFLRDMMKTGPKAHDAWCQREAMQRVAASPTLAAALPERCNADYASRLLACVQAPAGDGDDGRMQTRLRACMARLAGDGVRASR